MTQQETVPPGTRIQPSTAAMVEILAPVDMKKAGEAFKKFDEFKKTLLDEHDSVKIGDKEFLKKSAWRKWALVTGLSDEIVSFERIPETGKDSDGNFSYRFIVRVYHLPTGRTMIGVAMASKAEKKSWAHEEHDIFALAHTRAKNRGISDLVGGGDVSAEEMDAEAAPGQQQFSRPNK